MLVQWVLLKIMNEQNSWVLEKFKISNSMVLEKLKISLERNSKNIIWKNSNFYVNN